MVIGWTAQFSMTCPDFRRSVPKQRNNLYSALPYPSSKSKTSSKFIAVEAISSSTRTTYSSGVHQYLEFGLAHSLLYKGKSFCNSKVRKRGILLCVPTRLRPVPRAVKLYLVAIANFYIKQGMPLRTDHMFQLHDILKGIKRTSTFKQRTRCPITIQILSKIS